jgi:hypothetical protein
MHSSISREELAQKALVHLYNSAVLGSLRSTALALGMMGATKPKNPRLKDLQVLYELVGENRRLFYAAAAALAEFAVYSVLDFIERYNCFDSENNEEEFPHLSLTYMNTSQEGVYSIALSKYDSEELGQLFKQVARSDEMQSLIESIIDQLATRDKKHKE